LHYAIAFRRWSETPELIGTTHTAASAGAPVGFRMDGNTHGGEDGNTCASWGLSDQNNSTCFRIFHHVVYLINAFPYIGTCILLFVLVISIPSL
jgi:hypothetical protein